jgi:hypothetical protein
VLVACNADPVLSQTVKNLGPEVPGIPKGQYHRAGQPCLACHVEGGSTSPAFSVAGTIFYGPVNAVGVEGAEVRIVDANGSSPPTDAVITNCVGNFFVRKKDWNPQFPLKVTVGKSGFPDAPMVSLIGRDGSCATCHRFGKALDSVGHVYLVSEAKEKEGYTPPRCPVSPVAPTAPGQGNAMSISPNDSSEAAAMEDTSALPEGHP